MIKEQQAQLSNIIKNKNMNQSRAFDTNNFQGVQKPGSTKIQTPSYSFYGNSSAFNSNKALG